MFTRKDERVIDSRWTTKVSTYHTPLNLNYLDSHGGWETVSLRLRMLWIESWGLQLHRWMGTWHYFFHMKKLHT